MTREPDAADRRQTPVTAQNPGAARDAHDAHDRLLVARYAVGDALAADESAALRAQLAACVACSRLVEEIGIVQRATVDSFAPRRPRDFRISVEQAASLRPGAWQRLLGRLSAPRMALLRPLAGATLAIGIVFVGASAVVPRDAQVVEGQAAPVTASGTFDPDGRESGGAPEASVAADMQRHGPRPETVVDPRGVGESMPMASPAAPRVMLAQGSPGAMDGVTAFGAPDASPGADARDQNDAAAFKAPDEAATQADALAPALLLLGILLAATSGVVLLLAWLARRAEDPLLR